MVIDLVTELVLVKGLCRLKAVRNLRNTKTGKDLRSKEEHRAAKLKLENTESMFEQLRCAKDNFEEIKAVFDKIIPINSFMCAYANFKFEVSSKPLANETNPVCNSLRTQAGYLREPLVATHELVLDYRKPHISPLTNLGAIIFTCGQKHRPG